MAAVIRSAVYVGPVADGSGETVPKSPLGKVLPAEHPREHQRRKNDGERKKDTSIGE